MIKKSTLFRLGILLCLAFMVGYSNILFGDAVNLNIKPLRFIISAIGIMMAVLVTTCRKSDSLRYCFTFINSYLLVYILAITINAGYAFFAYGYSIKDLLFTYASYLYVFFAYPIAYVICMDGGFHKLLRGITIVVCGILLIKFICWYRYTNSGIVMFESLLFQYGNNWVRGGILRVDPGFLFGITYSYFLTKSLIDSKHRLWNWSILGLLIGFVAIITRFRFQLIVLIVEFAVMYYFTASKEKVKLWRIVVLSACAVAFVATGSLDSILDTFSTRGVYALSSLQRVETVIHYWNLMIDKGAILGLGVLSGTNSIALALMQQTSTYMYYLEDIGILGGFFRFGILAVVLYGVLFTKAVKTVQKLDFEQNWNDKMFLYATVTYMMLSCLALNIFDGQRAFDVPFYIAFISYGYAIHKRSNELVYN